MVLTAQKVSLRKYPAKTKHGNLEIIVLEKKLDDIQVLRRDIFLDADIAILSVKQEVEDVMFLSEGRKGQALFTTAPKYMEKHSTPKADMTIYSDVSGKPTTKAFEQVSIETPPTRGMCFYGWT